MPLAFAFTFASVPQFLSFAVHPLIPNLGIWLIQLTICLSTCTFDQLIDLPVASTVLRVDS